jgi:hypothetical protein
MKKLAAAFAVIFVSLFTDVELYAQPTFPGGGGGGGGGGSGGGGGVSGPLFSAPANTNFAIAVQGTNIVLN